MQLCSFLLIVMHEFANYQSDYLMFVLSYYSKLIVDSYSYSAKKVINNNKDKMHIKRTSE